MFKSIKIGFGVTIGMALAKAFMKSVGDILVKTYEAAEKDVDE